jgi:hypothetical protein
MARSHGGTLHKNIVLPLLLIYVASLPETLKVLYFTSNSDSDQR